MFIRAFIILVFINTIAYGQTSNYYSIRNVHTLNGSGRATLDNHGDLYVGPTGDGTLQSILRVPYPWDVTVPHGDPFLTYPNIAILDRDGAFSGTEQILQIGSNPYSNKIIIASSDGKFYFALPETQTTALDACQVGDFLILALNDYNYALKVDNASKLSNFALGTSPITSIAKFGNDVIVGRNDGRIERWDLANTQGTLIANLPSRVSSLTIGDGENLERDIIALADENLYAVSITGSSFVRATGFTLKGDIVPLGNGRMLICDGNGSIWRLKPLNEKGNVGGTVYDDKGVPIESATVETSDGDTTVTDYDGNFLLTDVVAGPLTIFVPSDAGHGPGETEAYVDSDSTSNTVVITDDMIITPGISEFRGRFFNRNRRALFLHGIEASERLVISVIWDAVPGTVTITGGNQNLIPIQTDANGNRWEVDVPLGSLPIGTELVAHAFVNGQSFGDPITANMTVVPAPLWLDAILDSHVDVESQLLYYKPPQIEQALQFVGGGLTAVGVNLPLLGDNTSTTFDIGATLKGWGNQVEQAGEDSQRQLNRLSFTSWGTGRLQGLRYPSEPQVNGNDTSLLAGIQVGSTKLHAWAEANLIGAWNENTDMWDPGLEARVGLDFFMPIPETPQVSIFMVGFVPVPYYYYGTIRSSLSAEIYSTEWENTFPTLSAGAILLDPMLELGIRLGVGVADWLAIEGGLAGGFAGTMANIGNGSEFQTMQIYIAGDIIAITRWVRFTLFSHRISWDLNRGETWSSAPFSIGSINSRDYLRDPVGFNIFKPQGRNFVWKEHLSGSAEETVVLNPGNRLMPDSDMDSVGYLATCWLEDDQMAGDLDYSRLVWSLVDPNGNWEVPMPVLDDGTWDDNPSIAFPENSAPVIVWENTITTSDPPVDQSDEGLLTALAVQMSKTDINVATMNGFVTVYQSFALPGAQISPEISMQNGTGLISFISLPSGDFIRDVNYPIDIGASELLADGITWDSPTAVASVTGLKKHTSINFPGGNAIAWTRDTDGNPNTTDDIEIELIIQNSGVWSSVISLTTNNIIDDSPQFVAHSDGSVELFWFSDGTIVSTGLNDIQSPAQVVAIGIAVGGEFSACANGQRTAVVYQSGGEILSDMWAILRGPSQEWSEPMQLTGDADRRGPISVNMDASGTLHVMNHSQKSEIDVRAIDFGTFVKDIEVPVAGLNSLARLVRPVFNDLSLDDPLHMSPDHPGLGTPITLKTILRNNGDDPSSGCTVELWHGNPNGGSGYVLDSVDFVGPIPSGGGIAVTFSTVTDFTNDKIDEYYVKIVTDDDVLSNNVVFTSGLIDADLSVGILKSVSIAEFDRRIIARIENTGVTPISTPFDVRFYEGVGTEGQVVYSTTINQQMNGNMYIEIPWTWVNAAPFLNGSATITVVVDPDEMLADVDRSNNTGLVTLYNLPGQDAAIPCPADLDGNGTVAVADLLVVIAAWDTNDPLADLSGNGIVDIPDVLALVAAWGACP